MPFILRSDEELIAEAKRGLEALGVEVVIDSMSSTPLQCAQRNQLVQGSNKVAIATSRAIVNACAKSRAEGIAAVLLATFPATLHQSMRLTRCGGSLAEATPAARAGSAWLRRHTTSRPARSARRTSACAAPSARSRPLARAC